MAKAAREDAVLASAKAVMERRARALQASASVPRDAASAPHAVSEV